jgi:uncharacterized Fe-S center protein
VGVKVSTGEPPSSNYLRQELIGSFVQGLNGTYLECNVAYFSNQRSNTAFHKEVAAEHGFTPIDIMDEDGDLQIPVTVPVGVTALMPYNVVGSHFSNYSFQIVLSHFKGHAMAGFGGALKNMSIGYGSGLTGKRLIHLGGTGISGNIYNATDAFRNSMAEAAKSIVDYLGADNYIYINVMNHLSVDCDCSGNPRSATCADIGIVASLDPVALDKASLDLVYAASDTRDLQQQIQRQNGALTVWHAAEIGLGSLSYDLVELQ